MEIVQAMMIRLLLLALEAWVAKDTCSWVIRKVVTQKKTYNGTLECQLHMGNVPCSSVAIIPS